MSKPNMIEKAKNLTLVVLFLSTILLLCFFWGNISFEKFSIETLSKHEEKEVLKPNSLIQPKDILVSFGGSSYTILTPDHLWAERADSNSFIGELKKFGPTENILVQDLSYENYQKVRAIRSIWAEFDYNIPFSEFCKIFGIDHPQSYGAIETVTTIGFSTAENGSGLFVYDGKNEKYYWLVTASSDKNAKPNGGTEFPAMIDSIEAGDYNSYYPISTILGVGKDTLIPPADVSTLQNFSFKHEFYSYQTDKINAVVKNFFGGNFDFVRRITEEDGTTIYMYGYGQNVLIVNTDGSFEYKEEKNGETSDPGFAKAMENASAFITAHGSWESIDGTKMRPYLKDVILNPDKEEGYRFVFGMEIDGTPLYYEKGDPIVVDVISGQVTYYKRQMIDFNREDLTATSGNSADAVYSPANLLAENYTNIYNQLVKTGAAAPSTDVNAMFGTVASQINGMQIGYVKPADTESTEIRPAWIVSMDGMDAFFDLYTAEPIVSSN